MGGLRCTEDQNESNRPSLPLIHMQFIQHRNREKCKYQIGECDDCCIEVGDTNDRSWSGAFPGDTSQQEDIGVFGCSALEYREEKKYSAGECRACCGSVYGPFLPLFHHDSEEKDCKGNFENYHCEAVE